MDEMTQLSQEVENALQKDDPQLKSKVAAQVDEMIQRCSQS